MSLSTSRLQHGLDYEIVLEPLRGERVDAEARVAHEVDALTSELRQYTTRRGADDHTTLQPTGILKEVLKDVQAGWQKAGTDRRTVTAGNGTLRHELASAVGNQSLVVEA